MMKTAQIANLQDLEYLRRLIAEADADLAAGLRHPIPDAHVLLTLVKTVDGDRVRDDGIDV